MTLKYTLIKKDFLEYYLYFASMEKVGKQIWRSTLISTGAFLLVALIFYSEGNMLITGIFVLASVLILIIGPGNSKANLRGSYHRIINKIFEHDDEQACTLEFTESSINCSSAMGRSELFHISLKTIDEAPEHFFIGLKSAQYIIVPKSQVDVDALRTYLQSLAQKLSIPFNSNLNWKWK